MYIFDLLERLNPPHGSDFERFRFGINLEWFSLERSRRCLCRFYYDNGDWVTVNLSGTVSDYKNNYVLLHDTRL